MECDIYLFHHFLDLSYSIDSMGFVLGVTMTEITTEQFNELATRFAQLSIETGIYKQALEEICYSESPDEFGIQVAQKALIKARNYLNSQGIKVKS